MSRATRSAITLSVLLALFLVGGFVGFRLLTTEAPSLTTATETEPTPCVERTLKSGATLTANQVRVAVLNASNTSGLANRTRINLEKRGFIVTQTGNATGKPKAKNVTLVSSEGKSPPARLVARQFKGKVRFVKPKAGGESVLEVRTGPKFRGLKKKAPAKIKTNKSTTVCIAVDPDVQD